MCTQRGEEFIPEGTTVNTERYRVLLACLRHAVYLKHLKIVAAKDLELLCDSSLACACAVAFILYNCIT
jgi:hypothetical protein